MELLDRAWSLKRARDRLEQFRERRSEGMSVDEAAMSQIPVANPNSAMVLYSKEAPILGSVNYPNVSIVRGANRAISAIQQVGGRSAINVDVLLQYHNRIEDYAERALRTPEANKEWELTIAQNKKEALRVWNDQRRGITSPDIRSARDIIYQMNATLRDYLAGMLHVVTIVPTSSGEWKGAVYPIPDLLGRMNQNLSDYKDMMTIMDKQQQLLELLNVKTAELDRNNAELEEMNDWIGEHGDIETRLNEMIGFPGLDLERQLPSQVNERISQQLGYAVVVMEANQTNLMEGIGALAQEREELAKEVFSRGLTNEEYQAKMAQLRQEHDRQIYALQEQLEQTKKLLDLVIPETGDNLNREEKIFQAQVNVINTQLEQHPIVDAAAQHRVDLLQQRLTQIQAELQNQKIVNNNLQVEANKVMKSDSPLKTELDTLQKQLDTMTSSNTSCQYELVLLRAENEVLKRKAGIAFPVSASFGQPCTFKRAKGIGVTAKTGRCMNPKSLANLVH
jgi:hypothetical protein